MSREDAGFQPPWLLVAARFANLAIGLGMIPWLLHFLGGEGFSGWAVLLAVSVAFSALEIGMPLSFVKHAAPLIGRGRGGELRQLLGDTSLVLVLVYAIAAPFVVALSAPAARFLHLQGGTLLGASGMIVFVYAAVAFRALGQFGMLVFNAAGRFRAVAVLSFLQSVASNLAAALAAALSRSLESTLVAYWSAQLAVTLLAWLAAPRAGEVPSAGSLPRGQRLQSLVLHGLRIQLYDWAQLVNFQFDKFVIVGMLGLPAVAPYEVANRSVQALRSLPSSSMDSLLSSAALGRESGQDLWPKYRAATRVAALAILAFMIAPLAVAPVFLFAWTGELGYASRWVFFFLLVGAAANVLSLPAAALAQAAGRAGLQARSAILSMALNVPLSLGLVLVWKLPGAAAGTAIAMSVASLSLVSSVHRSFDKPLGDTLRLFAGLLPLVLICAVLAVVVGYAFYFWLDGLDPAIRFARGTRLMLAVAAIGIYLACLFLLGLVQLHRGELGPGQRAWLTRRLRWKWFVDYCASRPVARGV